MTTELHGKVGIVTGGTSGIGRDAAVLFAKTDVSRATEVAALVRKTVEKFGRLDVAFNNAGIEGSWIPVTEQSEEDWDSVIDINLKGTWLCLKYEIQQMLKQGGGGAIVNMSSVSGLMGFAGAATYCASKHGVMGLTKAAALENARSGIRIQRRVPRGDRNTDGRACLRRAGGQQVCSRSPPPRPVWKAEGNRGGCGVDVLGPCILHDGPIPSSRWRSSGRTQSSQLTVRCQCDWAIIRTIEN